MNIVLILSHLFNFQGRENPAYVTSLNNFNIGLYSDICRLISFKLGMMTETTMFYISRAFKVTVVWEMKNFGVQFLASLSISLDEIQSVVTTYWVFEAHAEFIWQE